MGNLSLGESSKLKSHHKTHLLGELVEVKKRMVHKDEEISQLAKKIAKTIRSSSKANSRKEMGAAKNN